MLLWLTMIVVWILDRVSKILIQGHFVPGESVIIIPKIFHITYILNPGAAFGLLAGRTWIFVVTALVVFLAVIYAHLRLPKDARAIRLALGMIGGGALGNLYDRVVIGKVVDFLDFRIWPYIFNFADSMIVIGAGILILTIYLNEKKAGDV